MRRWLVALTPVVAACAPFSGFVHDEALVGPYRLVAVDTRGDMILCRTIEGGCAGDGLPGPTIFAAGANDRYIVLGRHPLVASQSGQVVTEYYYVIRSPDEVERGPYGNVRGPFDEAHFEREKRRLGLPEFSRTF